MSENEDEPDSVDDDEPITLSSPRSSIAPGFRLSPSAFDAINQAMSGAGALVAARSSLLKSMAPVFDSMKLWDNYKMNVMSPQLAETFKTIGQLNSARYSFAMSPGMKALTDGVASYQQLNMPSSLQMKATSDVLNRMGQLQLSLPVTQAMSAINGVGVLAAQQSALAASIKPVLDQLNSGLLQNAKLVQSFQMANAGSLLAASQSLASVRDSLKLQQSFAASEIAKTLFASSQALKTVNFDTLAAMNLASPYVERVKDLLAEDSALAEVATEVERRLIDRFKTSRETAHNAVLVLVWMIMFTGLMYGLLFGAPAVALVIGSVNSATSLFNADNIAKTIANQIVPLDKPEEDD